MECTFVSKLIDLPQRFDMIGLMCTTAVVIVSILPITHPNTNQRNLLG